MIQFQLINSSYDINYFDHVNYRIHKGVACRYSFIYHADRLQTLNPNLKQYIKDVKFDRMHLILFRDKNAYSLKHLPFNVILSKRSEIH